MLAHRFALVKGRHFRAREELEERRLSCTVEAHQRTATARRQRKAEVPQDIGASWQT